MKTKTIFPSDIDESTYKILLAYKNNYKDCFIGGGFARLIGHKVLGVEWGSKLVYLTILKMQKVILTSFLIKTLLV